MRKILSVFLLIVFSLFILITPSFAQSPTKTTQKTNSAQYLTPNTNEDVPKNLHTWTQNIMIEVLSAGVCQLSGVDLINPDKGCLGIDSKSGKIGYVKSGGGLIGITALAIGSTYTPPLHTGDYVRYLSQNFGIAKSTYAQGFGFQALNPLIPIWSIFRNLAYVVLIVIFLIIGIAIMLRVRIDPRTVMTIQNQIPKVVISLVLITLSFAIAGFLIDLMYVSLFLIYNLFAGFNIAITPEYIQGRTIFDAVNPRILEGGNPVTSFWDIAHNISLSGKDQINSFLNVSPSAGFDFGIGEIAGFFGNLFNFQWQSFSVVNLLYDLISLVAGFRMGAAASNITSTPIVGAGVGIGVGLAVFNFMEIFLRDLLPYLVIFAIVIIALIVTLFRVLFMLIIAFVSVLIDVILAPIWILGGLIPGNQSLGFGMWLRDLASNLAVFPAVYGMLILANVMGQALGGKDGAGTLGFAPPLLGNSLVPGFLASIVTLGIFLMTPNAIKLTKAAFKAPKIELGVGEGLGVGRAVVGGFAGGAASRFFRRDQQGNAVGAGAIWLSGRRNRLARAAGRFMGWQPSADVRQEAERRTQQRARNQPPRRNWREIGRQLRRGDVGVLTRRDRTPPGATPPTGAAVHDEPVREGGEPLPPEPGEDVT
ncbi:MAG: hypothetical protein A2798_00410 [Candidatus Levybacteria bacterium RIFCSPHIGHO2_01_FULL_37_17]|nr:MAG: hypothetical protein A2798_00410 [Candidatus Levybacteria bacterium RIFCSPHIGHO2_01_FULL_37_17]OGH36451.1 MAG: hypothetical protein A2959_02955 [Candidatus Levybacteria bacterium RIFCSPLOWO2_01_FULL_38_23]